MEGEEVQGTLAAREMVAFGDASPEGAHRRFVHTYTRLAKQAEHEGRDADAARLKRMVATARPGIGA